MPEPVDHSAIETLRAAFRARLSSAATDRDLQTLNDDFLGRRNGAVTALLKRLGTVPAEARREVGQLVNALKREIESAIHDQRAALESTRPPAGAVDVTLDPGRARPSADARAPTGRGHLCPHGL